MRESIETNNLLAFIAQLTAENIDSRDFYVNELDAMLSPIQLAAYFGHDAIVAFLIDKNANINAITLDEESFFQRMGRYFSLGIWRREGGFTALHLAGRGAHSCIKVLLANGADYRVLDRRGKLPLTVSQLCCNFSQSEQLTFLDLSIYGDFKSEYVDLMKVAFSAGRVKKIKIKFPSIDTEDGRIYSHFSSELKANERLDLFLTLLHALKTNSNFVEIVLDVKYQICTNEGPFSGHTSSDSLVRKRRGMIKILNSLLALCAIGKVQHINLGTIVHVHTDTKFSTADRDYSTKDTVTTTRLLKISNLAISKISADPFEAKKYFDDCDDSIMYDADLWGRLFSSAEDLLTKKIIDSEIIIAFCIKLSEFLQHNQASLVLQPSIEPCSAIGVELLPVSEAAGVGVSTVLPTVTPSVATNIHSLFNEGNTSAAEGGPSSYEPLVFC